MEKYTLNQFIEKGSYGSVYIATRKIDGETVAIKMVENKKKHYPDNEFIIHRTLNHHNIIKMYDSFYDYRKTYYVMEYADSGDLYAFIKKSPKEKLPEEVAFPIFLQIAEAILYCHQHFIIHRDIKTENILLTTPDMFDTSQIFEKEGNLKVKLTDFGLSVKVDVEKPYAKGVMGTLYFVSPEMITGKYSFETDIWSLGTLFYLTLTGDYPFDDIGDDEDIICAKIVDVQYQFPSYLSSFSKRLISKILVREISLRPPLLQIISYINLIMNAS